MTEIEKRAFHEAGHLTYAYVLLRKRAHIGGVFLHEKANGGEEEGGTVMIPKKGISVHFMRGYNLAGFFAEIMARDGGRIANNWPDEKDEAWHAASGDLKDVDFSNLAEVAKTGSMVTEFLNKHWNLVSAIAEKLIQSRIVSLADLHIMARQLRRPLRRGAGR